MLSMSHLMSQELASEQNRSAIQQAEQLRQSRRMRMLRRATRIEQILAH